MLKLTLPEQDGFYAELVEHPDVLRVVALSGGYTRDDANALLARNHGVVASFSRALTEGLTAQQSQAEFDAALDAVDREHLPGVDHLRVGQTPSLRASLSYGVRRRPAGPALRSGSPSSNWTTEGAKRVTVVLSSA